MFENESSLDRFELLGSARDFAEDIHDIFTKTPLFEALDLEETTLLCSFMKCYAAARGCQLIHEGDFGDHLMILLTGRVDVFKSDEQGGQHKIAEIGPGVSIGEMSMIDEKPREATCIAVEPVDFVLLNRQALRDILITLPRLGNKLLLLFLHGLAGRLREADRNLFASVPSVNL